MAPENVLEKIQKLLDLQSGAEKIGSLEEANNAAEKVQRLLTKYNLGMADVNLHSTKNGFDIKKFDFTDIQKKKNEGEWIFALYNALSRINYCHLVIVQRYILNQGIVNYGVIVGTKTNVGVVRKLSLRMEERVRTFEKEAWKSEGHLRYKNRNAWKRAYFMGAVQGLKHQLEEAREREKRENTQVNTLVVQNDKQLREALGRIFPNLTSKGKKRSLSNEEALRRGYHDGRNMPTGEHLK